MTGIGCVLAGSGPIGVTLSVAPTSRSASGTLNTNLFAAVTVSVTGGAPTAFNWVVGDITQGTWSVPVGQGTATAQANVTDATIPGEVYAANLRCQVTVNGIVYTSPPCALSYTRN